MSYVALDDNFADHPKVAGLSDKAFRLHVSVMCRCGRYLTDGEIAKGTLVSVSYGKSAAVIKELVDAGLWEVEGDGFRVHDYLAFNPSKAQVLAKRDAAKERMHQARSHRVRANTERTDCEPTEKFATGSPNPLPIPSPSPISDPTPVSPPGGASPAEPSLREQGGLQLAAPEQPIPSAPPTKPRAKREPTGNPNHKPLEAHYIAEFCRLRGGEPPPFGGREAGAIARLLGQVGNDLDRAKRIVTHGLSAKLGNPQTIVTIAADPGKWVTPPPDLFTRGRQGPIQPNGGYQSPKAAEGEF